MKPICKDCEFKTSANLFGEDAYWDVCKHHECNEMFPGGRALDLEEEKVPAWCPYTRRVIAYVAPKPILDMSDLEVNTSKSDSGACIVTVRHKPTGIFATANEYRSLYKNRDVAIKRLSEMLQPV